MGEGGVGVGGVMRECFMVIVFMRCVISGSYEFMIV